MIKTKGYVTFTYNAHTLSANHLRQLVDQYQTKLIDNESIIIDELAENDDQLQLILKIDGFTDNQRFQALRKTFDLGIDCDDDTDSYLCEAYGIIFPTKQITANRALAWVKHYTGSFAKDEFQKFTITQQHLTPTALKLEFAVELPSYVIDMDLYYLSDQERYQYFRLDECAPTNSIKEVPIDEYSGSHRLELSTHDITLVFKQEQSLVSVTNLLQTFEETHLMPNESIVYSLPSTGDTVITEVPIIIKALGINHQVIHCLLNELPDVLTVEVN